MTFYTNIVNGHKRDWRNQKTDVDQCMTHH